MGLNPSHVLVARESRDAAKVGASVALITILTWFIDIIAPAVGLPAVAHDLALTSHYGLPMLGHWDAVGIAASLVLVVGGVALGAWGLRRRDLSR